MLCTMQEGNQAHRQDDLQRRSFHVSFRRLTKILPRLPVVPQIPLRSHSPFGFREIPHRAWEQSLPQV